VTYEPKVLARGWHSLDGHLSGAFEPAQRVHAGRIFQHGPAEIEPRDWQDVFIGNHSWIITQL
jgi:hypothetical protein